MDKSKILSENVGRCLTKYYREDFAEMVVKFRQFAHISQFTNISRSANKLPTLTPEYQARPFTFRVDSSPVVGTGEMMFGVDAEGNMTWLAEIIDSSD